MGQVPQPAHVAQWGYATGLAYSESGSRFAAVGKRGWVAIWRQDARFAATPYGSLGTCDWGHHCLAKRGAAVSFLGASGSVVVVAGQGSAQGAHISVWDSLVPVGAACVASVLGARAPVRDVCLLPGSVALVAAMTDGSIAAYDLRMLRGAARGGADKKSEALWSEEKAHAGGAVCVHACPGGLAPPGAPARLLASGGGDGAVALWDVTLGKRVQTLERAHTLPRRMLFAFGHSEDRVGAKVKGVSFHAAGLVSCGHNCSVLLTPWAHLA